jgi:hypothetical protein
VTWPQPYERRDELDPLPYEAAWPDLRCITGRVDIHSLVAFFVRESRSRGHYLEFGVGEGRSAVAALRAHGRYNPEGIEQFFLFDSFEGLPVLEGPDEGSPVFEQGQFAFTQEQVRGKLERYGVWNPERVHLVPGFFDQSLPAFDAGRLGTIGASVVHVDVDLYTSARTVLDWVGPQLRQGTLMLFDDWNAFDASWQHGERRAVREWLELHPEVNLESWARYGFHGEVFVVHFA